MSDNDPLRKPWQYAHGEFQRRMVCPSCSRLYYLPVDDKHTNWTCLDGHWKETWESTSPFLVDALVQLRIDFEA